MIATNEFNILMFQKCGTHSIIGICQRVKSEFPDYDIFIDDSHLPASALKDKSLPTAVIYRNVWDWYVSRYLFYENARINQTGAYADERHNHPHLLEWNANCAFGESVEGFAKHLQYAVNHFPLGKPFFDFIIGADYIQFLRLENLKSELTAFITLYCPEKYKGAYQNAIQIQPIVNTTPNRLPAQSYYTKREIELVYQAEARYIRRFNQEFKYSI